MTNRTGQLYGLEAGANITLSVNGSNIVITATGSGGGLTTNQFQFLGVPLSIKDGARITNMNSVGTLTNIFSGSTIAMIPDSIAAVDIGDAGAYYRYIWSDSFRIVDNGGSGFDVQLHATALSASYDLLFPAAQGGQGTVMTNDGTGQLGWYDLANLPFIKDLNDNQFADENTVAAIKAGAAMTNGNFWQDMTNRGEIYVDFDDGSIYIGTTPFRSVHRDATDIILGSSDYDHAVLSAKIHTIIMDGAASPTPSFYPNSDGIIDLGYPTARWKEFWLREDAYIGGHVEATQYILTNSPGLDRNILMYNTNGNGYTAISGPTNQWLPTNRFFLYVTNPVANQVLKILSVTAANGVKSIILTNGQDDTGSGDAGGTNARQFGTLSLTNLSGNPNVATNILGAGFVSVSSNNAGVWTITGNQSGETNFNGEVSVTNSTRIGVVNGKSANTNLLRSLQGGNGIILTNEGTNVMVAIDPAVVASQANLTAASNTLNSAIVSATNSASVTNWINFRQPASTTLSNLAGTGAVTNLFTPSLSNATIKPVVFGGVGNAAGMTNTTGQLYGLEAGANITLTPNGSNITIAATAAAADSLWSSNSVTLFPGMYTNRVAIGSNTVPDGTTLYVLGYTQTFPGAQNFENYAQGSGQPYGFVAMLKHDGYSGDESYCIQSRNDVNNHGGTLNVLTGDKAAYGIDCINTFDETGSKIAGATCAIQGYAGSANSANVGISGVATPSKATSTNIAAAGVVVRIAALANTKDVGLYAAVKTSGEIATPAVIARTAVSTFDSWTSNVPLLVLQTNNGNIVVYVDNAGNIIATNTVFARVSVASPSLSSTNFPGLDRQLTFWNTNGNGYTAFSAPTNDWRPTNRFFLTITNPVAGQVLKILSTSFDSGVASIVLTNDTDNNPTLTTNANQFAGVPLSIKESPLLTNTIHYSSDTNRTNIAINQRIGQLVPMLSVRGSNDAPLVEVDNAGYILLTNNLTARAATPTNTIAIGAEDYGGLTFPTWTDGHGLEFNIQPALFNSRLHVLYPNSGTTIGALGTATPVTTGGTTISHTTPDELAPYMVQVASATSSNSSAGVAMTNNVANAGAHDGSSKMGGYFYSCEWSITNFIAGIVGGGAPRAFIGLANAASPDLTNIVQTTNATGQYIGLMLDAKQSLNMFITCRDSVAEFRTNSGINFVATNIYSFSMFNAHTSRFVGWRLRSLTDGTEAKGWFSNNVPTNFMKGTVLTKNGTNRANEIRFSKMYIQAPLSPN